MKSSMVVFGNLGRFTVNQVNFVLEVKKNSNNVETKFLGRRISIDEVISQ